MNIVYCGHNVRGVKCLEKIYNNKDFTISLVVTHPCKNIEDTSSVNFIAKSLNIDTIDPQDINAPETLEIIKSYKPDVVILSGYTQIVKEDFISIANKITINLHGGKLPEYRGSAPLNWMLINDESSIGISIIEVAPGIDTGDILCCEEFTIDDNDSITTIVNKTFDLFPNMLEKVLYQIKNNTLERITQDLNVGNYYPSRKPNDGLILFEQMTAREVFNLVRALQAPYPYAFSFFNNKKINILEVQEYKKETVKGLAGKIILKRDDGVLVMCKDQTILLKTVQFEEDETIYKAKEIMQRGDSFRTLRTILLGQEDL